MRKDTVHSREERLYMELRRGDIIIVDLGETQGHEKQGIRPAVVISSELMNENSDNVIVAPMTSASHKQRLLPTHVYITSNEYSGLKKDSIVQLEDIRSVSKQRMIKHIGCLTGKELGVVDSRIGTVFFPSSMYY